MKASLEREIEVVEHIISQLKTCLALYHKNKMHDEFRLTLHDIQIVKKELQRLLAAKAAAKVAEKGAAKNVCDKERSREIIS